MDESKYNCKFFVIAYSMGTAEGDVIMQSCPKCFRVWGFFLDF